MSAPTTQPRSLSLPLGCAVFLSLFGAAGLASADPSPALDRISVSAGGFYAEPKIKVGADTRYGRLDTGDNTQSHTTIPRVKADILIGDSHGISLDYYRYDKNYDPTLAASTVYEGTPLNGTAAVDAKLKLDLAQVAYKWWLGSGNDVFGIGLGAAYYRAKLGGSATGTVQGNVGGIAQTVNASGSDSVSESAYAPLLELGWRHAFSPDLRLVVDASGVKKNGGRINGHIYGGSVGVEWFPFKNVGFVADYGISKIKLNRDSERSADLNVKLTGPSAYLKVRF